MFAFISKLQQKPEHVRRRIAIIASAALTGLVTVIWLISLGNSLGESAPGVASKERDTGPFQDLTKGFGDFFSDTAETLQGAAGAFSGLSSEGEPELQSASQDGADAPFSP